MKALNLPGMKGRLKSEDPDIADLPVFLGENEFTSAWGLSLRERLRLLFTGTVYCSVLGGLHPPLAIHLDRPETEGGK